jgi:hypothetical protein
MHQKEEKPDRKLYYSFQKSIQNNQPMKKTQVCSELEFCKNTKTNVETSSLRNLKIMPRNEIVCHEFHLSWTIAYYAPVVLLHKVKPSARDRESDSVSLKNAR